jgi:hypothetical protein
MIFGFLKMLFLHIPRACSLDGMIHEGQIDKKETIKGYEQI